MFASFALMNENAQNKAKALGLKQFAGKITRREAHTSLIEIEGWIKESPHGVTKTLHGQARQRLGDAAAKPVHDAEFLPDQLLFFFKTGPFAWNGALGFWVPLTVFCGWFISIFVLMRRALAAEATASAPRVLQAAG